VNPQLLSAWPLEIQVRGDASNWLKRLGPLVGMGEGWQVEGQADLSAAALVSIGRIDVSRSQVSLKPLSLRGYGLAIQEPEGRFEGIGWLSSDKRALEISQAGFVAGGVSADLRDLKIDATQGPSETSGKITFQGDAGQLARWLSDPNVKPDYQWTGSVKGDIVL